MSNFDIKKLFPNDEVFTEFKKDLCKAADAARAPVIDNNKQLNIFISLICEFAYKHADGLNYLYDVALQNISQTSDTNRSPEALDTHKQIESQDQDCNTDAVCERLQSATESPGNNNINKNSP